MKEIGKVIYLVFAVSIAMIGYNINNSLFWAIIDFLFSPIALVKWLICKEINLSVILETFNFLTK